MTSEKNLTEEFFRVFGIEPEYTYIGHYPLTDENGIIQPPTYPEITAKKLLEMICIMRTYQLTEIYRELPTIDKLKEDILKWFINQSVINEKIKKQIKQLFSE